MSTRIECRPLLYHDSVEALFTPGVFGAKPEGWETQQPVLHMVMLVDGKPVCHVGVLERRCLVNGAWAFVRGIGGVVTVESERRRGYARQLINHAVAYMHNEWSVDLCILFCLKHLIPYYTQIGWKQVPMSFLMGEPQRLSPPEVVAFTCPVGTWTGNVDALDLQGVAW